MKEIREKINEMKTKKEQKRLIKLKAGYLKDKQN